MSKDHDELSSRIEELHAVDIDPTTRTLYLFGVEEHPDDDYWDSGVEFRQANRFIRNLSLLTHLDQEKPILVYMKSPGGYVDEGFAMFDAMRAAPMPITIAGFTCVASMASVLLQAANKRVLMPHATFMFHAGFLGAHGTPKQVAATVHWDEMFQTHMMDIYVDVMKSAPHGKCRNWSRKRIRDWLKEQMDQKEDVYLTAEQAVHWGFADEIFQDWSTVFNYTDEELLRK